MKAFLFLVLVAQAPIFCQEDTLVIQNRYFFGFLPSGVNNVYGIALGPVGSEARCDKPFTKKSHGLNLQILGQGFFTPFYVFNKNLNVYNLSLDTTCITDTIIFTPKALHNGLLVSGLGTFTDVINGISISPWMSLNNSVNGLSLNFLVNNVFVLNGAAVGLYNETIKTNGVQIGLVNRTHQLKGVQLGLWNVTDKRKLPLVNWSFR